MATRFERTSPSEQPLSELERRQFFQMMKKTVVTTFCKSGKQESIPASGIIIDAKCRILTCHGNIVVGHETSVSLSGGQGQQIKVKVIHMCSKRNMVLLEPLVTVPASQFGFVSMLQGKVAIGSDVYCIGHPSDLRYSFLKGQVVFPCIDDTPIELDDHEFSFRILGQMRGLVRNYNHGLPLIQINNTHGSYGIYGAPAFDSDGYVIGMLAFKSNNFDLAIHHREMSAFINEYESQDKKKIKQSRGSKRPAMDKKDNQQSITIRQKNY